MNIGDHVRLRRPFQPLPGGLFYDHGVITGLVADESKSPQQSAIAEVVVYLYDPTDGAIYTDEQGEQVLYSFYPKEVTVL
jgi:hypothetical protein